MKYILEALLSLPHRDSRYPAVQVKSNKTWENISWKDYYKRVELLSGCLKSLGLQKGECLAILSETQLEWSLFDFACLAFGGVSVPIYHNHRVEELEYILNDSMAKILICGNDTLYKKWLQVRKQCPHVTKVILICSSDDREMNYEEALSQGSEYTSRHPDFFTESIENIGLDDRATIIYTSGAIGTPKGVVLSHRQISSELTDVFSLFSVGPGDKSLSFLPYAHVMGRVESWGCVFAGYTLAYGEHIEKLEENLQEVKPTFLIAVPRTFEKIYNEILADVETSPARGKIFSLAFGVGFQVSALRMAKKAIPLILLTQYILAKKLVFNRLKERLGGNLRFAISGGAPLEKKIAEFFHAADILILEGYGLTETSAAVTINTPLHYKFGTVGRPINGVEIKMAEDGEILVKSDKVMVGYHKVHSSEVTVGEYFATGDMGEWTSDGFLRVTDRKKDLIKTSGGKYVSPQKLENLLRLSPYISHALIHGDRRKYVVALITLNSDAITQFARDYRLSFNRLEDLSRHRKVKELIRNSVSDANAKLSSFEMIKQFSILGRDFTTENGELTPSLKIKRKFCDKKFKDEIDKLYR